MIAPLDVLNISRTSVERCRGHCCWNQSRRSHQAQRVIVSPISGTAGFYEAFYTRVKRVFIAVWLCSGADLSFYLLWDKRGLESHRFRDLKHITPHSSELVSKHFARELISVVFEAEAWQRRLSIKPVCFPLSHNRKAHTVVLQAAF